ncbi:hypothetical protein [Cupriavidus malaysiensis]|uniref:hypothetical protein n=1 Tax=Cupriavidus malaysiensis TaxID=367825 RepID=UPI0012FF7D56|nr:hypothetical protein [Cupriavidus malaysiensis]
MIVPKPLMATACLAVSLNALACKPLGLDTEVQFERGASTLTASNVRKLAHWHAAIEENFHGKGAYLGELKIAPSLGVSVHLTQQREGHLRLLLGQLGVKPDRLEIRTFAFKGSKPERADIAGIGFEPDCPNPCCPGP